MSPFFVPLSEWSRQPYEPFPFPLAGEKRLCVQRGGDRPVEGFPLSLGQFAFVFVRGGCFRYPGVVAPPDRIVANGGDKRPIFAKGTERLAGFGDCFRDHIHEQPLFWGDRLRWLPAFAFRDVFDPLDDQGRNIVAVFVLAYDDAREVCGQLDARTLRLSAFAA